MKSFFCISLVSVLAVGALCATTGHHHASSSHQPSSAAHPSKSTIKEKVLSISKKCATDNKLTRDQSKIAFTQDLPKNDAERCYLECVYSGVGVVHGGAFSADGANKLISIRFTEPKEKEAAGQLVSTCAKEITKKDGEKCSLGKTVRECFVRHGKQVHFFPSA